MQRFRRSIVAGVLSGALVLTGCTSGSGADGSGEGSEESSPKSSTSASSATPSTQSAKPSAAAKPTGSAKPTKPTKKSALNQMGVAAGHPDAAQVGVVVLEKGGNAIDAAIATAFAVSVLEPHASGIGGGGVTLVAEPSKKPTAFDYREVVAANGKIPESGTGVPGFVDGMWTLHQKYGSLPWADLLAPAAKIAREGFAIPKFLGERMNDGVGAKTVARYPQFRTEKSQRVLKEGDTLIQDDLAATISAIASGGRDEFYTGSISKELAQVEGLDAQTLRNYRTEQFAPVSGKVGDYTVVSAPPALPGAGLIQMLQQAEGGGIAQQKRGSSAYVETLMKAWSNANETVTTQFGDQRFVKVNTNAVLDRSKNLAIGSKLDEMKVLKEPDGEIDPGNTTHLTVVDADGMMVSMTNTITSFWGGSKSEVVGGFFLNNQLSRFWAIDSPKNRPQPGRKSVTWSNPTMVLDASGRPVMGIGSPGGQQIPNILSSVLVPTLLQGNELQNAVDGPRFHLQGGELAVEGKASKGVRRMAKEQEWDVRETTRQDGIFGSVQALQVDYTSRSVIGATDSRRDGGHVVADVASAG